MTHISSLKAFSIEQQNTPSYKKKYPNAIPRERHQINSNPHTDAEISSNGGSPSQRPHRERRTPKSRRFYVKHVSPAYLSLLADLLTRTTTIHTSPAIFFELFEALFRAFSSLYVLRIGEWRVTAHQNIRNRTCGLFQSPLISPFESSS